MKKTYLAKVKQELDKLDLNNISTFNQARKVIFNSKSLQQLVVNQTKQEPVSLSGGTSQALACSELIKQVTNDLQQNKYYRDYAPTAGNLETRQAIALVNNQVVQGSIYESNDICLTNGSTGAITAMIEVVKKEDSQAEILIASPAYYLYKLAVQYWQLSYKEVNVSAGLDTLLQEISDQTKLIIVCNPNNPGGEIYQSQEIEALLVEAKRRQIMVMADLLFDELVFTGNEYISFAKVAQKVDALNNLIIIKGFSKSKNLAGLRIGYTLSKNITLNQQILRVLEQRQCFAVASIFTGLICLDSCLQTVRLRANNTKADLASIIVETKAEFDFCQSVNEKSLSQLTQIFESYSDNYEKLMSDYQSLYRLSMKELRDQISLATDTKAAFNTFVKFDLLRFVNQFDFTLNLYLLTGVKIEIGPCFGWTQVEWEDNPDLGFWLRLSFSQNKTDYQRGLKLFKQFISDYLKTINSNKWIKTELRF